MINMNGEEAIFEVKRIFQDWIVESLILRFNKLNKSHAE